MPPNKNPLKPDGSRGFTINTFAYIARVPMDELVCGIWSRFLNLFYI
ncbi:hypothetical protein Bbad01_34070 [Bacillus badius]|nr:hypothetical protein Bbad01_34070 [Bacillus badius]